MHPFFVLARTACCLLGMTALLGCRPEARLDPDSGLRIFPNEAPGSTMNQVRRRGHVLCGVSTGISGFSMPDAQGQWQGLDVDICRAVAAAVLGDAERVQYVPLTAAGRFMSLKSKEVDLLARNTTWTITRDTAIGLAVAGINYYDGQSFMLKAKHELSDPLDLAGQRICVQRGTTSELNLGDYFRRHDLSIQPVLFDTSEQALAGLVTGRCLAITSDRSQLYGQRSLLANPQQYQILEKLISKEPLGPVVRYDDSHWFNVVKWSLFAMINAEELGITHENWQQMRQDSNPEIRRLLGTEGPLGDYLGLSSDWASNIIAQVGNYGESYERNLGPDSAVAIPRGLNRLWYQGGILYAPPFR